jgi:hypothetical protein
MPKYNINKMVVEQMATEELDYLNENLDYKGKPIVGVEPIIGKFTKDDSVFVTPLVDINVDRREGVNAATEYLDHREGATPFVPGHIVFLMIFMVVSFGAGYIVGNYYGERSAPQQTTMFKTP